jgi:hypothetical protein
MGTAEAQSEQVKREARLYSERRRGEADQYAAAKRKEIEGYDAAMRKEADEYAATTAENARAEAEATRRKSEFDAHRLVEEALDHRTAILRELTRRRDLAGAQIRSLMAGRDLVVEALGQVGALVAGITDGLQEIGTAPTDFVQLDPAVEGVTPEPGAAIAVTRRGQRISRMTKSELPGTKAVPALAGEAVPAAG